MLSLRATFSLPLQRLKGKFRGRLRTRGEAMTSVCTGYQYGLLQAWVEQMLGTYWPRDANSAWADLQRGSY